MMKIKWGWIAGISIVLFLLTIIAFIPGEAKRSNSSQTRLEHIASLDKKLKETSGLALVNNILLTHNDRGGKNELYSFDSNGSIASTIVIKGAVNTDWESLAQSDTELFIGDIGNNDGDRQDLTIYIVDKTKIDLQSDRSETPVKGEIRIHYPEQSSFEKGEKHNFDCEAILYFDNHLYLFMKHRKDDQTTLYKVQALPGAYPAQKMGAFRAGVRITGADIRADGTEVLLIGYNKKGHCVIWKLSGYQKDDFLSGEKEQFVLGTYKQLGQMEAIKYFTSEIVYITSEKTDQVPASLYRWKAIAE